MEPRKPLEETLEPAPNTVQDLPDNVEQVTARDGAAAAKSGLDPRYDAGSREWCRAAAASPGA
ncbi:MAG: hypothetical protein LC777_14405 [Actinobacteria bacterium]|nr:hypothetical protein [Actinomycetota bacterium]